MGVDVNDRRSGPTTLTAGQTGPHSFDFAIAADADLRVTRIRDGVEALLTLTTHYTVSVSSYPGTGTITLVDDPEEGDQLVIDGDRALERATSDFVSDRLDAADLNTEYDAGVRDRQEIDRDISDCVRVPRGEGGYVKASAANRAGKYEYFDESGDPAYGETTDLEAVAEVVDEIDAIAADLALGASSNVKAVGEDLLGDDTIGQALSSASAAAGSASAAASSASSAASSASDASSSASAAASSAAAASSSASSASDSADDAAASAASVEVRQLTSVADVQSEFAFASYGTIAEGTTVLLNPNTGDTHTHISVFTWAQLASGTHDGVQNIQPTGQTAGRFVFRGYISQDSVIMLDDRAAVNALPPGLFTTVFIAGEQHPFDWSASDHSADLAADPGELVYVAAASGTGAYVRRFEEEYIRVDWNAALDDTGASDVFTEFEQAFDLSIHMFGAPFVAVPGGNGKKYLWSGDVGLLFQPSSGTIEYARIFAIGGLAEILCDTDATKNRIWFNGDNGATILRARLSGLKFTYTPVSAQTGGTSRAPVLFDNVADACGQDIEYAGPWYYNEVYRECARIRSRDGVHNEWRNRAVYVLGACTDFEIAGHSGSGLYSGSNGYYGINTNDENRRILTISGRANGDFTVGETVTGSSTGAYGTVVSDDGSTELRINLDASSPAEFSSADSLSGDTSSATADVDASALIVAARGIITDNTLIECNNHFASVTGAFKHIDVSRNAFDNITSTQVVGLIFQGVLAVAGDGACNDNKLSGCHNAISFAKGTSGITGSGNRCYNSISDDVLFGEDVSNCHLFRHYSENCGDDALWFHADSSNCTASDVRLFAPVNNGVTVNSGATHIGLYTIICIDPGNDGIYINTGASHIIVGRGSEVRGAARYGLWATGVDDLTLDGLSLFECGSFTLYLVSIDGLDANNILCDQNGGGVTNVYLQATASAAFQDAVIRGLTAKGAASSLPDLWIDAVGAATMDIRFKSCDIGMDGTTSRAIRWALDDGATIDVRFDDTDIKGSSEAHYIEPVKCTIGTVTGGPFVAGETVTGAISGHTAVIATGGVGSGYLMLQSFSAPLIPGEELAGGTSSATADLTLVGDGVNIRQVGGSLSGARESNVQGLIGFTGVDGVVDENGAVLASVTTDGSGDFTIAHGIYDIPNRVAVQNGETTLYHLSVTAVDDTNLTVRVLDDAGSPVTSTSIDISWQARKAA